MKLIRYKAHNETLHIGTSDDKLKLSVFFKGKIAARIHLGKKTFHFGNW